jgi:surface carbohydrate biosynthesis protein (TIGR04326 family)
VFFKTLKPFLSGIASILKRFTLRYRATFFRKTKRYDESKNVTIFSYFTHLSRKHYEKGEHYSFMWTELPNLLMEKGWAINWLQHYLPNGGNVSLSQGLKLLDSFNDKENNNQNHMFLDSHLGLSVLWCTFRSWFRLRRKALSFQNLPALFQVNDSGVNLWPLLKSEWISSTSGSIAASNCFWVALFDSALRDKPKQELGLYLHEGQAWEFPMLTAWRKYGHGQIVSVQHSAAPFWHLYYFNDESVYLNQSSSGMPVPDLWSTNGLAAYNAFLDSGYPSDKVMMLEALRYLDLDEKKRTQMLYRSSVRLPSIPIKVLVLGDLSLYQRTDELLLALKHCIDVLPKNYQFTFKPHPVDNTKACQRLGLDIALTTAPLTEIIESFDIAIAGHGTSAVLDAFLSGVKTIVFLDSKTFNLSPLRGSGGAEFVSSSEQIIDLLSSKQYLDSSFECDEEFFLSDSKLIQWNNFLSSQEC